MNIIKKAVNDMISKIIDLRQKNVFGILILASVLYDVVNDMYYYNYTRNGLAFVLFKFSVNVLMSSPRIILGICALIPYKKFTNILMFVSMVTEVVCRIVIIFSYDTSELLKEKYFFAFVLVFVLIDISVYVMFGVLLLKKHINIKAITVLIISYILYSFTVVFVVRSILYDLMATQSFYSQIKYSIFTTMTQQRLDVFTMLCVLLFLWCVLPISKKESTKINIDTNVVDFKEMLQYVEYEYSLGRITAEEYNEKRKRILSKL